jgi:sugar lactone lactonase YvrE
MRKYQLFITACVFAIVSAFPALPVQGADKAQPQASVQPWVWPLPPDKPRVQFIRTVITPQDLGIKKGFFARVWDFVAGEDTVDRIVSPHGLVADGEGKFYVADWGGACIHFFDFEKKKYDKYNMTKMGPLVSPIGAALDADGLLYVTDSSRRRVFVYSGSKNKRIIGDDSLLRPTGIAVNKKEKLLYIVDTTGHRVDLYTLEGKKTGSFGKGGVSDGEFNYPTHIAVDATGDLYVMDTLNFRVQIFDKAGKFLSAFGGNGTAIGAFIKPKGIAVDREGHIWVSDGVRNSVQVFDRAGRLLLIFGRNGTGAGQFDVPAGLYLDSKDRLYVADSYNYRVQMFQYLQETN